MLISGPMRANRVVMISPGITKANEANPPTTHKMPSATSRRTYGNVRKTSPTAGASCPRSTAPTSRSRRPL